MASVRKALLAAPGVVTAEVNFAEHTAQVAGEVNPRSLIQAIVAAGYNAAVMTGPEDLAEREALEAGHYRGLLRKAAVAALIGMPLMAGDWLGLLPSVGSPAKARCSGRASGSPRSPYWSTPVATSIPVPGSRCVVTTPTWIP